MTDKLKALIAALRTDAVFWDEPITYRNEAADAILALIKAKEYAEAERDANAARLDWIQRHLFGHKWNGVIDSGSQTRWDIWSGYRHETQHLIGNTFAEAIDNAIAKKGQTHD